MPIAQIHLLEGRTEEQKKRLIAKVTEAICESLGVKRESVRVVLYPIPKGDWGIGGATAEDLGY